MATKKTIGQQLAVLVKTSGRSQTELANELGMNVTHLNRFFRGRSDVYAETFIQILNELDIDMNQIVSKKLNKQMDRKNSDIHTALDCLCYLFESLDPLGRQAYLSQLAWAVKIEKRKKLPDQIQAILSKEITLI